MRLTTDQVEAIRQRIESHMGPKARIWQFDSRVDDSRRGGDVDLDPRFGIRIGDGIRSRSGAGVGAETTAGTPL